MISVSVSWMNVLVLLGSSAVEGGVSVGSSWDSTVMFMVGETMEGRIGANGVVLVSCGIGVNDRVGTSSAVALISVWPVFCEFGVNDRVGTSRLQASTRVIIVRLTLQAPPSVHEDAMSVVYVQELSEGELDPLAVPVGTSSEEALCSVCPCPDVSVCELVDVEVSSPESSSSSSTPGFS